MTIKDSWNEFKKEITLNNFKIVLSATIPMICGGWIYVKWLNLLTPIMKQYEDSITVTATPEQAVILISMALALILPIFPLFSWTSSAGMYLGRITKFFRDDKSRSLWFDDKYYSVKDMPEGQREKLKELLAPYKSKLQLRKEARANLSWFKRNFT